jgi:hypothetical protein
LDLGERNLEEAGENCILKSFILCTLHLTFSGRSDYGRCEMIGAWSSHGRIKECIENFSLNT